MSCGRLSSRASQAASLLTNLSAGSRHCWLILDSRIWRRAREAELRHPTCHRTFLETLPQARLWAVLASPVILRVTFWLVWSTTIRGDSFCHELGHR